MRSKRYKHKSIIESSIEGYSKGYSHRRHRVRVPKSNILKLIKKKELDNEWDIIRNKINIFGDIDND